MRATWTDEMVKTLEAEYETCEDLKELACKLGVSINCLKYKAHKLCIQRKKDNFYWTEQQDAYLRRMYAESPMSELKTFFHRSKSSIYQRAIILGLRKSKEYLAEMGRRNSEHPNWKTTRFKKGHTPFNKGKKESEFRSKESCERCKETQFKVGQLPHNAKPVGYECTYNNGYVYIKVEGERKMQLKHRYIWERHHGPVPKGMCIAFRDGNRQNCDISNLMLITEAERMTRVTASLTPEQKCIRKEKGQTARNESIRKDKMRIRWGLEPKGRLVKKWYAPDK